MQNKIDNIEAGEPTRSGDQHKRQTPVSRTEAVKLAKSELLKLGRKLENYRVNVEASEYGSLWEISFYPISSPSPPGCEVYVFVDKNTGAIKVLTGR